MRNHLVRFASPLLLSSVLLGCTQKTDPAEETGGAGGSGSTQGTGGSGASGGTGAGASGGTGSGGAPGEPGWTAVPLIDDLTDPDNPVFRTGEDLVTGIYFASIDDGWITTTGSDGTFGDGGAVFKAKQKEVSEVLFGGDRDGLCLLGSIDFTGLEKSPDGLIATAYACDVIASHDGGKTFGIEPALAGQDMGIEPVLAMRVRASDTVMVADSGYIAVTSGVPGPNAVWTDIWAPDAVPTTPDPVPADQCQGAPSSFTPTQHTSVYVSPGGDFIAYVATPNFDPQVCISTDGGKSFFPKVLSGIPEEAENFIPTGVVFGGANNGIAYWASSIYPGKGYVYHTNDAGKTWAPASLPAEVVSKSIELASAFFAPGGMRGWIVGFDYDASLALIMRTDDGGATWKASGGDLAAKVSAAGGGKLFTGFALDDNRIWIGGKKGILMANEAGGE
jgi:hypothetical protein